MAKAESGNDVGEQEFTKKLDIVCYLNREDRETRRQFADRVDENNDYFERKERVREYDDYYIRKGGVEIEISEDQYESLSEGDTGDMDVVHEHTESTETDFRWRSSKPLRRMFKGVFRDALPESEDMPFGWDTKGFTPGINDSDGNSVTYTRSTFERMPMLKHASEIEPDDMYVDEDEEHLAYKTVFKVKNVNREQLEWVEDNITSEIMTELARHEWIDRVRTYDCEMETKEKGVCYNI